MLGLLGPNGAGKTTTVRILATLLRADAGRARVAGLDVARDAQAVRKLIGLSGQYAAVDENLTGRENLWMFGAPLPAAERGGAPARRRAARASSRSTTRATASRRRTRAACAGGSTSPPRSSGGPRLLFLDEPTTGLDPRSRLGLWDVIRSQVREGNTLLLTTQYLEEADELADEIAVVDHGRIIARGTADELKTQVGGERIEVVVHDRARLAEAAGLIAPDGSASRRRAHEAGDDRRSTAARSSSSTSSAPLGDARHRDRRRRAPAPDARRRVPRAHRARRRGAAGRGGRVSALPAPAADGLVIAWRTLKRVPRIPELAIFAILQSIMFVVLFAFVFGGAIPLPGGGSYREYLMPGIYIQTLTFASITTAIAFADDMTKGIIDRFRSLPMARSAVLSGRTFADVVYTMGILVVLMLSGPRRRLARPFERRRLPARRAADDLLHVRDGMGRRATSGSSPRRSRPSSSSAS